jgi:hypothetical protein
MVEGVDYTISGEDTPLTNEFRPIYLITLTIMKVDQFTHNRGYVTMELSTRVGRWRTRPRNRGRRAMGS